MADIPPPIKNLNFLKLADERDCHQLVDAMTYHRWRGSGTVKAFDEDVLVAPEARCQVGGDGRLARATLLSPDRHMLQGELWRRATDRTRNLVGQVADVISNVDEALSTDVEDLEEQRELQENFPDLKEVSVVARHFLDLGSYYVQKA